MNDSQINEENKTTYKFGIFDRNVQENQVKIAYEFEGLNFSYASNNPTFEKEIKVHKLAVPKYITINNTEDLANGDTSDGVIVNLTFTVPKDVAKDYAIEITPEGVVDDMLDYLTVTANSGKISVVAPTPEEPEEPEEL